MGVLGVKKVVNQWYRRKSSVPQVKIPFIIPIEKLILVIIKTDQTGCQVMIYVSIEATSQCDVIFCLFFTDCVQCTLL